jgi:DNA replication and checkpoint protein
MLSASGGSTATPSAKRTADLGQAVIQTPSRRKVQKLGDILEMADRERTENEGNDDDDDDESAAAMGRTPASSSKRLYLERLFATPTTLRFATMMEEEDDADADTIQQISLPMGMASQTEEHNDNNPLGSGTPSFLRRSNSGRYTSNNAFSSHPLSPVGARKHQRFNRKGLTALVQGLRDMEKERMEDDWDILNELEADQNIPGIEGEGDLQVVDSQVPHNEDDKSGKDRIIRKRTTQKRTTRLVKMKPVIQVKRKPSRTATTSLSRSNEPTQENKDDDESEDELATLDDSRPRDLRERKQAEENNQGANNDEGEEDNYSDIDSDNSSDKDFTESAPTKPQQRITSSFTDKIKAAFSSLPIKDSNKNNSTTTTTTTTTTKKSSTKEKKEKPSPKKRKVNPDAHANYRSLKIRSKGQGRFGKGRFGRR